MAALGFSGLKASLNFVDTPCRCSFCTPLLELAMKLEYCSNLRSNKIFGAIFYSFLRVAQPWALQCLTQFTQTLQIGTLNKIVQYYTIVTNITLLLHNWHTMWPTPTQRDPLNVTLIMWPTQRDPHKCDPHNVTHTMWPTQYEEGV